jgi:hypothetical protein
MMEEKRSRKKKRKINWRRQKRFGEREDRVGEINGKTNKEGYEERKRFY